MSRVKNPRMLLAAGVVIAGIVLGIVFLPGAGGGSDDEKPRRVTRASLTLERSVAPATGQQELLVSLPGPQLNTPQMTGGASVVWLRCTDSRGMVAVRRPVDWPLIEEVGYPPHIHQPAGRKLLNSIRRCKLTGPGIDFSAVVPGPVPAAG